MMSWRFYDQPRSTQISKTGAQRALEKERKKNPDLSPVIIEGRTIARTWWGKSWNLNLERYADYASRIGRGRTYVRNGAVLDLKIDKGSIKALVAGSKATPYKVAITIDKLPDQKWQEITHTCSHRIGSLGELLEGNFPESLASVFFNQKSGLFPSPKEIHLSCTCPDWAVLCKHVAAVLYGVGARLDQEPLLFFTLRDIGFEALLKKSAEEKVNSLLKNADKKTSRMLDDGVITDLFQL